MKSQFLFFLVVINLTLAGCAGVDNGTSRNPSPSPSSKQNQANVLGAKMISPMTR